MKRENLSSTVKTNISGNAFYDESQVRKYLKYLKLQILKADSLIKSPEVDYIDIKEAFDVIDECMGERLIV